MTRSVDAFYFKSYGRTIGTARDVKELNTEIARLVEVDSAAVAYHLSQGHIVQWLEYAGEKGLAELLRNVQDIEQARNRVENYLKENKSRNAAKGHKTRSRRSHERKR